MKDVDCPYCEKPIQINHDDGFGYEEDYQHEYQCPHCEKNFIFWTTISVDHQAEKADCLNDGNHDYGKTKTIPVEFARLKCRICGHEKPIPNNDVGWI